jgi:hypothetical protein
LALAVPLSLFTSSVGGGSAFYVRVHMSSTATRLLKIASRNLADAQKKSGRRKASTHVGRDCAAVSIIMTAAAIECCVQTRLSVPVLQIESPQLQRFFGALITEFLRAPIQRRLAFLASLDSRLELSKGHRKVIESLFSHRNRLIHSSLTYREMHYLPDDSSSWDEFTEFEMLPKRGVLEFRGWDADIVERAERYYSVAEKLIQTFESVPLVRDEKNAP